jgi:hypothetical protein
MTTQRKDTQKAGSTINIIFNYCNCDILAKVRKPHSPTAIYFLRCDDPYLIDEVTFMLNSGSITSSCQVSKPDLRGRIEYYTHTGYAVEYVNANN